MKKHEPPAKNASESEEYEYTDEEEGAHPKKENEYEVERIVEHKSFVRGEAFKMLRYIDVRNALLVDSMEKSGWNYAFRVRWRGFPPEQDTWEPIESFPPSFERKMRRYCRRNEIKLPPNFMELLHLDPDDVEEVKGIEVKKEVEEEKEEKKREERKADLVMLSSSSDDDVQIAPAPPKSKILDLTESDAPRKKGEKSSNSKERAAVNMMLADDLALSRSSSPSPVKQAQPKVEHRVSGKVSMADLFDYSDEEEGRIVVDEEEARARERRASGQMEGVEEAEEAAKKNSSVEPPSSEKRKRGRPKKGKGEPGESQHSSQRIEPAKQKSEGATKMKNDKKEKDRLLKLAQENIKQLEEEEKKRKNEKLAKKAEEDNLAKVQEEERKKKNEKLAKKAEEDNLARLETEERKKKSDKLARLAEEDNLERLEEEYAARKKEKKRLAAMAASDNATRAAAAVLPPTPMGGVPAANDVEMVPRAAETKNDRKRKHKEKRRDKSQDSIMMDTEEEVAIERKEKKRDTSLEMMVPKREEKREKPKDGSRKREESTHKEQCDNVNDEWNAGRRARALWRLELINQRRCAFAEARRAREEARLDAWEAEERRWRAGMVVSGQWETRSGEKLPFDIRADEREADMKKVRTLRRCQSAERLAGSFRRLSTLHSLETSRSAAESLTECFLDCEHAANADALVRMRERRKKAEEEQRRRKAANAAPAQPLCFSVQAASKRFIEETIEMAEEFVPGLATKEEITELCEEVINAYILLDDARLIALLEKIGASECINRTLHRLTRLFAPVVSLAERTPGCVAECDGGQHLKCSMLLTVLMAASGVIRAGAGAECLLPPNALYDALDVSADCQMRAMIRGGCSFTDFYDEDGRTAAHRMMAECSLTVLVWLIERGLDVNAAVLPETKDDLDDNDAYERPWKLIKECNEKAAFLSQLHSQRLAARSLAWTMDVEAVRHFNLRPLSHVHTLNAFCYYLRFATVTLCGEERRKGAGEEDAVVLAVHSATVQQAAGLRVAARKMKRNVPDIHIPYFLIDRARDDENSYIVEHYKCLKATMILHHLPASSSSASSAATRREATEECELQRIGHHESTTLFKVPRQMAKYLASGRRFVECHIRVQQPAEHTVLLAQLFLVPFKNAGPLP